jgi:outer membrane receptor protein involved in Fe transport
MNKPLLVRVIKNTIVVALLAVLLLAHTAVVRAEDTKKQDEWRFTLVPYIWLPSVSGSFKFTLPPPGTGPAPVPGVPTATVSSSADVSSNDYLSNLTFAGMLSFEAAKGRWSLLSDILYVDFSDSNRDVTIPGLGAGSGVLVSADTGLQAMIFEVAGAYSVYMGQHGNFDVLLGMRYAGIEGKIDINAVGPAGAVYYPRINKSLNMYDPIVGFKGRLLLTKNWFMPYYFDIGGFSVDSDLTVQAYAAIGYRFTDWFSMTLGYRYLYYDFGNSKLLEDITLHGGMLGFVFSF